MTTQANETKLEKLNAVAATSLEDASKQRDAAQTAVARAESEFGETNSEAAWTRVKTAKERHLQAEVFHREAQKRAHEAAGKLAAERRRASKAKLDGLLRAASYEAFFTSIAPETDRIIAFYKELSEHVVPSIERKVIAQNEAVNAADALANAVGEPTPWADTGALQAKLRVSAVMSAVARALGKVAREIGVDRRRMDPKEWLVADFNFNFNDVGGT